MSPKTRPAEPVAQQPSRPARVAAAAPSVRPAEPGRAGLALSAGGFYGGGLNRGPWVGAVWTTPWSAARLKLGADVELGWRLTQFSREQAGFGAVTTALHAVPLLGAARLELLRLGPLALDARAGIGLMFLLHHLASSFAADSTRFAVGWEAFAGGQARLALGAVELYLDGRYGLGEARMPFVVGRSTGLQGALGVRYLFR